MQVAALGLAASTCHERVKRLWDEGVLRQRVGVIFQDFARYQLIVGENIGAGDVRHFNDERRWQEAATQGLANDVIEKLPLGFHTQLGKWFADGRELSGGQWQKIALSRAFMRTDATVSAGSMSDCG